MAEPSSSYRLLGNSAWNAAAFLLGMGINLLILPFVISRLGLAAFGVASLVTACIAPAQAFSSSLALSTAREFAQRLAPDEREEARRFFAASLLLAIGVGGSIATILCLAGPPLARLLFHLGGEAADDLGLAFAFGAGGWWCQCLSAVFLALFTARQDYFRIASIQYFKCDCRDGKHTCIRAPLATGLNISRLSGHGFCGEPFDSVCAFASRTRCDGWPVPRFITSRCSDLVKVGAWQLAAQVSGLIAGRADRYLLGALLAPQFVGFYTVAQRLEEAVYIGVLKIGEILFPFFSALQSESNERKADLVISFLLGPQRARRERSGRADPRRRPATSSVDRRRSSCANPAVAGGALDCRHAWVYHERICVLSSRQRPDTIQRADLVCHGGVYARHQRGGLTLLRMAGGGLERLRRHGRSERRRPLLCCDEVSLTLECGRRWPISFGCHWQPA